MRWLWASIAGVVVLAAVVAGLYHRFRATADRRAAPLEIVTDEIDLGTILTREERAFEATVRNNSDQPLHIDRIRSGCGCTKVRLEKNHLEPGESTELRGTARGGGTPGPFRHQVMLMTSGPRPVRAVCFILGQAQRRIRLVPDRLELCPDFLSASPDSRI